MVLHQYKLSARLRDKVLFERFINRVESQECHPGHIDHLTTYGQFAQLLQDRKYDAVDIGESILEFDTTDFETMDFEGRMGDIVKITGEHLE